MILRDYQKDIIEQTINSNKSTLIQVPTGGGKTIIAKEIITHLVDKLNKKVLFVAPKIILMEQTAEVFHGLNPYKLHGNNKSSNEDYKILVSTNQTASLRDTSPDVIIIDEVHYGYEGKMIQKLIQNNPKAKIIGLSATPYDKNGEQLKGFDLVLDKYDMKYMVEKKYLVNIESHVLVKINKLDTLKITAGDYNQQALSKIVSNSNTILEIVGSTAEYILKYKKTIVFAVDIGHAELLTKAYKDEGFTAKVIHSDLSREQQKIEIQQFKDGHTKILVSVAMLTTGFDVPDTDVAVIARPTKSQNLYKQMVGRVLRLAPNKSHALLLDCGNVIENLGKPLDPIKPIVTKEIANNQQKCESCNSINLKLIHKDEKSFWECKDCGHTKGIEHGNYTCKLCGKIYTHDAKFSVDNNKLLLHCNHCPYPTIISKFTGDEVFVSVDDRITNKMENYQTSVNNLNESIKPRAAIKKYDFKKYENSGTKYSQIIFEEAMSILKEKHKELVFTKDGFAYSIKHLQISQLLSDTDQLKLNTNVKKQINMILRMLNQNTHVNFGLFIKNYEDVEDFLAYNNYFKTELLNDYETFLEQKNIIINVQAFIKVYGDEEKIKNINKALRKELGSKYFFNDPQKESVLNIIKNRTLTQDELFEFYSLKSSIKIIQY